LPEITRGLINAGMSADMPCMVVENGTRHHQRAVTSSLQAIPYLAHTEGLKSPAIIVVGEVVKLARNSQQEQDWQENVQTWLSVANAA